MRKLIIFMVRKRLHLKPYEIFTFVGQKSDAIYYFTERNVMKNDNGKITKSRVSLNWLLDENCEIVRTGACI